MVKIQHLLVNVRAKEVPIGFCAIGHIATNRTHDAKENTNEQGPRLPAPYFLEPTAGSALNLPGVTHIYKAKSGNGGDLLAVVSGRVTGSGRTAPLPYP
jgi:hypothetical protein